MIPIKKGIENEIHDDAYFEEEVKKTNLIFEEKIYLHLNYIFIFQIHMKYYL